MIESNLPVDPDETENCQQKESDTEEEVELTHESSSFVRNDGDDGIEVEIELNSVKELKPKFGSKGLVVELSKPKRILFEVIQ